MNWMNDWPAQAACRGTDPDRLFSFRERHRIVPKRSALAAQCALNAWLILLDNEIEFGVWGGMTERERRALLRRRPDVRSWRTCLRLPVLSTPVRTDYVTIPAQQVSADLRSSNVDLRSRTSVAQRPQPPDVSRKPLRVGVTGGFQPQ